MLAGHLAERNFRYADLTSSEIDEIRCAVCIRFTVDVAEVVGTTIAEQHPQLMINPGAARMYALTMDGNQFTDFLETERTYLINSGESHFTEDAWELALQVAIAHRGRISLVDPENSNAIAHQFSTFSRDNFVEGRKILCDDEHSPASNESTATHWSWLWGAGEFLGGTAIFAANLLLVHEPNTKAFSMYFGAIIGASGYAELKRLMPRDNAG